MKSSKILKIIWVSGIYVILILILYLIITYKVKWEDKDLNTYLYFYKCSNQLCTTTTSQNDYYNKILCKNNICPYIDSINKDNVVLSKEEKSWIYNYTTNKIINNKYIKYKYLDDKTYIVTDENENYGIIDIDGNVLVNLKYNYIKEYKNGYIVYMKDNLYGIENPTIEYNLKPTFEDIVLINDKIFAGKLNNTYQLHTYDNINDNNNNKYNYVYSYNDIILVANNKKIDILDNNLNSTLLMKIDTFFEYTIEKERDSLNITTDGINIYFEVFINETEYTKYTYNIKNKKLL